MRLPQLEVIGQSRQTLDVFGGYNHNLRPAEGEWYEQYNMTAEHYPLLANRARRYRLLEAPEMQGMIARDALAYIDGSRLVYNGQPHELELSVDDTPKQMVSMGAYILIWPDKKYFNTQDLTDFGSLGARYESAGTVTFSMTNEAGEDFKVNTSGTSAPSEPEDGEYWLDTSQTPPSLKVYSAAQSMWTAVSGVYVKIRAGGIGAAFKQHDGVHLSGIVPEALKDLNDAAAIIWQREDDWITVTGICPETLTQETPVVVERRIPDMEYLTESENRVWGCHYGMAGDKAVNEIYACKLGDPKNWNCFMGVSTDSYAVSVGTDGEFTGAVTYLGMPTFFKENAIHRISGSYPAAYRMHTTDNCRGVQRGSWRSLVTVDEALYYKGVGGVMAYNGSLPECISRALGVQRYEDACAGELDGRYYITMKDEDGSWHSFQYDTQNGIWSVQDELQIVQYCRCRDDLYFRDAQGVLWSVRGIWTDTDISQEDTVSWSCESAAFGYTEPDRKYISRIELRFSLEPGAVCEVAIRYDDDPVWEVRASVSGQGTRSISLPIRPRRCDHFRLRLRGAGDCRIFSLTKVLETGSEV